MDDKFIQTFQAQNKAALDTMKSYIDIQEQEPKVNAMWDIRNAVEGLKAEAERNGTLSTTVISLCELYAGAYGSREPQKELLKVQELLSHFTVLNLDAEGAQRYGELVNEAKVRREPIGDFDLIVASIALNHAQAIVTRNIKHFSRVPGLIVEEW